MYAQEDAADAESVPSVCGIVTIEDIFEELIQAEVRPSKAFQYHSRGFCNL